LWQQPREMPQALAEVHAVHVEEWACPLGSSVNDRQGHARVQRIDAASAEAATSVPGRPTGDPGKRPGFASVPTGHGQRSGTTPKRSGGLHRLPGPAS
jgi:hypothetical protein